MARPWPTGAPDPICTSPSSHRTANSASTSSPNLRARSVSTPTVRAESRVSRRWTSSLPRPPTLAPLSTPNSRTASSTATSGSPHPRPRILDPPSNGSPTPGPTSSRRPCSVRVFEPPSLAKVLATWACPSPRSTLYSSQSISSAKTRTRPLPASTPSSSLCTSSSSSTV